MDRQLKKPEGHNYSARSAVLQAGKGCKNADATKYKHWQLKRSSPTGMMVI